ncbi:selenocysteine-specific translation elongation factor [Evansella sp. AB-P1]|uniref:selenocysteine-specific translation elongation factor n=1 Tax=Evansella sp. AB-P1 TaxID=3037653 RepID=UPI00241FEB97|nr:selenocysteine-specific translation elongation factor [Evansella sp. AB-P1]MDG5789604.1 selenocysteine-specific translation elongation factor [Evansella sp. AB-P1]
MVERFYTIGMAGHIDHGKTTLTKALTNIDTDRLKEERERAISIELGYAPLILDEESQVSIIDVPGHEKFIRQMIAGVAGIDLVLLVVAADEGVMPQTVEHLDILRLLGIQKGLIVVTKMDQVDEDMKELIEADISDQVEGTFFEGADLLFVDSLSKKGIPELKDRIRSYLSDVPMRDAKGAFRLPIDQVFTVHGQGTVVRGTVYEGVVQEGEILELLPQQKKVRARQLQVHHQPQTTGRAGQRVAINLGGISKQEVKRGDVLVSTQYYSTTETIDVSLDTVDSLNYPLKQRGYIKLHIGTAEVYGKIVFFDRNELTEDKSVLCQLRLDSPVVTKRGDRFILRRPTPMETIGGGVVIDPNGEKYKFGEKTIEKLSLKKEGTPSERVVDILKKHKGLPIEHLEQETSMNEEEINRVVDDLLSKEELMKLGSSYLLTSVFEEMVQVLQKELREYHDRFPLREGKNKAELKQDVLTYGLSLAENVIEEGVKREVFKKSGQFIALASFLPSFPQQWEKRMKQAVSTLEKEGLEVSPYGDCVNQAGIPKDLQDELRHFLIRNGEMIELDEKHLMPKKAFDNGVKRLYEKTDERFNLQDAKGVLNLTRKYLVPFMERLDVIGLTKRDGNDRIWLKNPVE